MQSHTRIDIMRRLAAASREPGREAVASQTASLPIERYLDPAVLEQERSAVFYKRPLIVAHVSELPGPGDFITEDVLGVPLLITRNQDGQVRVFHNVCRHQGVRLVDDKQGSGWQSFMCPFHQWNYSLDGALLDIGGQKLTGRLMFLKQELRPIAHEERHGFVWVRLDGAPDRPVDVAGFLGPALDDDFEHFALAGHHVAGKSVHVRACNWKLVMDALAGPHGHTRSPVDAALVDDCAPHVRHVSARQGWPGAETAGDLREHATVVYSVFPTTALIFHPQWVSQIGLFPEAVDRVRVVHRMLVASPTADADRRRLDESFRNIDEQILAGQDLPAAEDLQRTLGAGREIQPGTRLFHQAWDRAMSGQ